MKRLDGPLLADGSRDEQEQNIRYALLLPPPSCSAAHRVEARECCPETLRTDDGSRSPVSSRRIDEDRRSCGSASTVTVARGRQTGSSATITWRLRCHGKKPVSDYYAPQCLPACDALLPNDAVRSAENPSRRWPACLPHLWIFGRNQNVRQCCSFSAGVGRTAWPRHTRRLAVRVRSLIGCGRCTESQRSENLRARAMLLDPPVRTG